MARARTAPIAISLAIDNRAVVCLEICDHILVRIVAVEVDVEFAVEAHQVVIID